MDAQISFIKVHQTGIGLDAIASPIELPNGNFACSVINHSEWYNVIYLFSRCGELITTLQVSEPDEYVYMNHLAILGSGDILATGYSSDSVNNAVYLILDPNTLDVKKERKYFSELFAGANTTVEKKGVIFQIGGLLGINTSSMNLNLQRSIYLYRDFNDPEYPGLRSSRYVGYTSNRVYSLEGYDEQASDRSYHSIRCMDHKLRDQYIVLPKNDTTNNFIDPTIMLLGNDTLLLGLTVHHILNNTWKKYIRKYYRDSLVFEQEVFDEEQFFDYGACYYHDDVIKCVFGSGEVSWYNTFGNRIFHSTSMMNVPGINLASAHISRDGGFFAFNRSYELIDGVYEPIIKITKTTGDYEISLTPHPECIVSDDHPENESSISVFPNPANGIFHVKSSDPVIQYQLYDLNSRLLMSEKVSNEEFNVRFDMMPGSYIILLETKLGWITKKLLVIH